MRFFFPQQSFFFDLSPPSIRKLEKDEVLDPSTGAWQAQAEQPHPPKLAFGWPNAAFVGVGGGKSQLRFLIIPTRFLSDDLFIIVVVQRPCTTE